MVAPPVPCVRRICHDCECTASNLRSELSGISRLTDRVSPSQINKAQGQTLERVGVYLSMDCFSHGQLYVAASRVGLPSHIRFAVDKDEATGEYRTRNVVWRDALTSTSG